jgi:hypothetical protein
MQLQGHRHVLAAGDPEVIYSQRSTSSALTGFFKQHCKTVHFAGSAKNIVQQPVLPGKPALRSGFFLFLIPRAYSQTEAS